MTDIQDGQKVKNFHELMRLADAQGIKQKDAAELCNVSATMISNWKNINHKDQPRFEQIKPLIHEVRNRGLGFEPDVDELPDSGHPAPKANPKAEWALALLMLSVVFGALWYSTIGPCFNDWDNCKKLGWNAPFAYVWHQVDQVKQDAKSYRELRTQGLVDEEKD